jgi:ubiquinone biosynthesis monooxygenase Coq7
MRNYNSTDSVIGLFDNFLKTVSGTLSGTGRKNPGDDTISKDLAKFEKRLSGKLMRVNHAGEVAAQALYQGQLLFEKNYQTVDYYHKAANEEADHLIWTSSQIKKLDSHESYFNSLWYWGAFFLGVSASLSGEKKSIGFLAETERQVAEHLANHLKILPENDKSSRLVVETMLRDETEHASWAEGSEGFTELPKVLKNFMQQGAKIMVYFSQKI